MAQEVLSVSDAACTLTRELEQEIRPRDISRLFYERDLRDDLCPIVSGRRVIPQNYLPIIAMALKRRGWIRQRERPVRKNLGRNETTDVEGPADD